MRHSDIRLTVDRYGHLFPGSEAAAIERIRGAFFKPSELRLTGTGAPLRLPQQSGCDAVRARCETVPLATLENPRGSNKKTLRFHGIPMKKQGFVSG